MSGPYFGMPDGLPDDLLDAGLSVEHVGLLVLAWSESSRSGLDGQLARSRFRALRGWTERRESDLARVGAIVLSAEAVTLVDYLTVNRTRAEIERIRDERRAAGAKGGQATVATTPRDDRGRFATPSAPPNDGGSGSKQVLGRLLGPLSTNVDKRGTNASKHDNDIDNDNYKEYLQKSSEPDKWRPFLTAWQARGLARPPSDRQRETLWPVVDACPTLVADWLHSAPKGADTYRLVEHVLKRWRARAEAA
jgi:hypothetical protein